jgi:hypothetical protein
MRPLALLGLACACAGLAACGKKGADDKEQKPPPAAEAQPRAEVPDKIEGKLTLDGKPLAITKCRPGRAASIYVDLVTEVGALRFLPYQSKQMYWNPRPEWDERGLPVECTDLRRSWGGGTRDDGTTYFRGQLIFSCRGAPGVLAGDVTVDCGDITPLERRLLDESRRRKLDELDRDKRGSGDRPKPGGTPGKP